MKKTVKIIKPDKVSPLWLMLVESHCSRRKIEHPLGVSKFAYELRNRIVLQLDPMVPNTFSYPNHRFVPLALSQRSPVTKEEHFKLILHVFLCFVYFFESI